MRNKRLNNKKCAPHRMHHHAPNRRETYICKCNNYFKESKKSYSLFDVLDFRIILSTFGN